MEFAMSGQGKRKRCKKWVTTRGYFRDIMVSCLKPRAYSRRLPTSSSSEGIRGRPLGRAVANYQGVAQSAEQLAYIQRWRGFESFRSDLPGLRVLHPDVPGA